jgi:hypothetical protein
VDSSFLSLPDLDISMEIWQFISVPHRRLSLVLFLCSGFLAAEGRVAAESSSLSLFGGPSLCFPVTTAPDNPALPHLGWGIGAGAELSVGRIRALRLGADMLFIGASSVSPEGVLYRAWDGLRLSMEAGYAFPIGPFSLGITAGGSLTAAEYSGTSLVFAYPSILARAEFSYRIARDGSVRLGLPLEIMLRGAYLDVTPALSAAYAYSLPLKASR